MNIALNYGGRQDILNAASLLAEHAWKQNHKLTDEEVKAAVDFMADQSV